MFDGTESEDEEEVPQRSPNCGVLNFHNGTEEAMFFYLNNFSRKNDVDHILKTIDTYCYQRHWMMHIGEKKAQFLEQSVRQLNAAALARGEVCVELGSYCGYSALRIARLLGPQGRLYCIERETQCVEWSRRLLEFAGMAEKVTFIEGSVDSNTLNTLRTHLASKPIDLLFIDHDKSKYKEDLEQIVNGNFLQSGSIVVADNILSLNTPLTDYIQYVKNPQGPFQSSETFMDYIEYCFPPDQHGDTAITPSSSNSELIDGVEVSVFR